jgi:D-3-phosphoglycerate dehydrogenase
MTKLVISTSSFDVNNNPHLQYLLNKGMRIVENSHKRKLTENEAIALLDGDTVGMIAGIEPLTEHVLSSAKSLKVISRCGSGLDSVDLAAAKRHGMTVLNTPEAPAQAVAELTLALMLAGLRQVCQNDKLVRAGQWPRTQGRLLAAQRVGIVGLGRVGKRVARLCSAFEAEVVAYDSYVTELPQGMEDLELIPLEKLLAEADIISLHVPYDTDTRHLLDKEAFARMKPGAMVINTARGGLIDEAALAEALASGRLAWAALDVFEQEPYQGELLSIQNAILTSHIGSLARESRQRMELEAAENLLKGLVEAGVVENR